MVRVSSAGGVWGAEKAGARCWKGPAFGLSDCAEFSPSFPAELFSGACVSCLVAALKERDATLNGTFNQAQSVYQDGKLSIHLAHGGYDLLAARNTDAKLRSPDQRVV